MRAQATAEFMLMFLATLLFLSLLAGAMAAANGRAKAQARAAAQTAEMEEFVRTFEAYSNSGIAMFFRTGVRYEAADDTIRADYGNRTMVARGIYDAVGKQPEPV